jgi:uncharacterized SAM-binding protein YcdF (DUF218 family)
MFFILQKIIWFLILPLSLVLFLIIAGLIILKWRERLGKGLVLSGVIVLYVLSLGHTADFILKPLEEKYPPLAAEKIALDAVVVPGGGSVDLAWINANPVPNSETLSRVVLGVELARKFKVPLVLCGGNGEPFTTTVRDADPMAAAALAMGMPANQVLVENESRNTLENARAVRKLLKQDRIILATSAYYMRRAKAMFTRQGFVVIPAPTFFLAQTRVFSFASFIPKAGDLSRSTTGIAEWISLAWWSIRGEV